MLHLFGRTRMYRRQLGYGSREERVSVGRSGIARLMESHRILYCGALRDKGVTVHVWGFYRKQWLGALVEGRGRGSKRILSASWSLLVNLFFHGCSCDLHRWARGLGIQRSLAYPLCSHHCAVKALAWVMLEFLPLLASVSCCELLALMRISCSFLLLESTGPP